MVERPRLVGLRRIGEIRADYEVVHKLRRCTLCTSIYGDIVVRSRHLRPVCHRYSGWLPVTRENRAETVWQGSALAEESPSRIDGA